LTKGRDITCSPPSDYEVSHLLGRYAGARRNRGCALCIGSLWPYGTDPTVASIGFRNGHPAGSAAPLTWAAGTYARLLLDIVANRLLEQPTNTVSRYITHTQGQTTLTLTAPTDASSVAVGQVTVSGATAPGNSISIAATNIDSTFQTTNASATPDKSGAFTQAVAIPSGTTTGPATTPIPRRPISTRVRSIFRDSWSLTTARISPSS
jgi:hypothetical protein